MRLFGLIGYPLGHSFSKSYFTGKFTAEGISHCRYELFPIENIGQFPALLKQYPELEGINITIPYKKEVTTFLTESWLPKGLDACNCIKVRGEQLIGYNTDVVGFEKSLTPKLKPFHTKALVLGTGGASAAVIYVLKKLGIDFQIVSRTGGQHKLAYENLDGNIISDYPIIINTTPLGTYPAVDLAPAIPYQFITAKHYLFDLVYNPAKTRFLQEGEARGATIQNGYDMLVFQAEEGWRIWNEP